MRLAIGFIAGVVLVLGYLAWQFWKGGPLIK